MSKNIPSVDSQRTKTKSGFSAGKKGSKIDDWIRKRRLASLTGSSPTLHATVKNPTLWRGRCAGVDHKPCSMVYIDRVRRSSRTIWTNASGSHLASRMSFVWGYSGEDTSRLIILDPRWWRDNRRLVPIINRQVGDLDYCLS